LEANAAYRRSMRRAAESDQEKVVKELPSMGSSESGATIGLAIKTAAARTGNYDALKAITRLLRDEMPEVTEHLGLSISKRRRVESTPNRLHFFNSGHTEQRGDSGVQMVLASSNRPR